MSQGRPLAGLRGVVAGGSGADHSPASLRFETGCKIRNGSVGHRIDAATNWQNCKIDERLIAKAIVKANRLRSLLPFLAQSVAVRGNLLPFALSHCRSVSADGRSSRTVILIT